MKKPRTEHNGRERVRILNIGVDVCEPETAVRTVFELASAGGAYVCVANVHMTMEAFDDPTFAAVVNEADLVLPDGKPLVWIQRRNGMPDAEQVRGPSLFPKLMEQAAEAKIAIGFFGSTPETIDAIKKNAGEYFPEMIVGYSFAPPFRELSAEENVAIADEINAAGVRILFVGLGCPKQERWMAANKAQINSVMVGVGAAFDIFAGNVSEAPKWMQNIGLEWLYRFALEPKRLWRRYLVLNSRFLYHIVRSALKG